MARPKQDADRLELREISGRPELLGFNEVAEVLGVTRRHLVRLTDREDFPPPIARLKATPVWERPDVEKWAKDRKPNGRRKQ